MNIDDLAQLRREAASDSLQARDDRARVVRVLSRVFVECHWRVPDMLTYYGAREDFIDAEDFDLFVRELETACRALEPTA